MSELSAEHFEQVSNVPRGPVHVVVNLSFSDRRRLSMDDNLLDDEAHAGEPLPARRVFPDCFLIDFVHSGEEIKFNLAIGSKQHGQIFLTLRVNKFYQIL